MRTIVSLLLVSVILCALPAGLAARTINIPADEAIIQAGIAATAPKMAGFDSVGF